MKRKGKNRMRKRSKEGKSEKGKRREGRGRGIWRRGKIEREEEVTSKERRRKTR